MYERYEEEHDSYKLEHLYDKKNTHNWSCDDWVLPRKSRLPLCHLCNCSFQSVDASPLSLSLPPSPTTPSALTADWWRAVSATLTHCINFMSQNTSGDSGDNTHTLPSGFPIPSSGSGNYCKESLHWSHIQHKLSIHTDCSLYASLGSTVALKHSSLINHQCTLK